MADKIRELKDDLALDSTQTAQVLLTAYDVINTTAYGANITEKLLEVIKAEEQQ